MEVVLDRDQLLRGLQMVQNIVEPRQTLPILANVLLETDGDSVRITATDLEVGARVSMPAKVGGKGKITVSARKLSEIVKELQTGVAAMANDVTIITPLLEDPNASQFVGKFGYAVAPAGPRFCS